jgi:hypothetical protein
MGEEIIQSDMNATSKLHSSINKNIMTQNENE